MKFVKALAGATALAVTMFAASQASALTVGFSQIGSESGWRAAEIYALSGFLAGLSGIVFSLYTSAGYALATVGVELDAIAAVVIGGHC